MLLSLPLEIWEMIFDLLPGQDLQLISKVPRLRVTLAIARTSTHRLEAHRAGFVDASQPGSRPLAERIELLKAYRARWESLRWAKVICLPPRFLWIYHFAGNVLAYVCTHRASFMQYLRLPFGGTLASSWEDYKLELEHGIKTFSAYPEKNLLAVLEEWFDDGWWVEIPRVRLHIRRLDSARDIVVPHNGQLTVCRPFTTDIDLNVYIQPEDLSCEIEQIGHRIAILFACYTSQEPGYCAKFIMWNMITQQT
ncbi:hypothetical protein BDM02DRAFT_1472159 [Thelephora ganbajun]|uniref:Uncharacterized protein n=1 Tax=Thelephora ganbajun TaxID=370292 RepID=A0ACB6Z1H7_THEGA|nr:hypothetical protein BDM02DRAFT_1472159 [Thelephora ganbajun]